MGDVQELTDVSHRLIDIIHNSGLIVENSVIDYKVKPHKMPEEKAEFFKDILGLLNSYERPANDRYLVYGIADDTHHPVEFPRSLVLNDADYQDFFSKISPRPHIEFCPIDAREVKSTASPNTCFACFYIPASNFGKVYEMNEALKVKDEPKRKGPVLSEGASFIRNGSRTQPLRQDDRERILSLKQQTNELLAPTSPLEVDRHGLPCLLLAAIVGSWDANLEGDRSTIEALTGEPYQDWVSRLRPLLFDANPCVSCIGSVWTVSNRVGIIGRYSKGITPDLLEALARVLNQIYCTPRQRAVIQDGDVVTLTNMPRYSDGIRTGTAEFLAIIGTRTVDLPACADDVVQRYIYDVLQAVLCTNNVEVLDTASSLFLLFEEAAPTTYLHLISRGIDDNAAMREYLQQKDGALGRSHGHELFLGIEQASREHQYFSQAMTLLLKMYSLSNLASETLVAILLPWNPIGSATTQTRIAFARALLDHGGWNTLLQLLPGMKTYSLLPPEPRYKTLPARATNVPSDYRQVGTAYLELAISSSAGDVGRIVDLIRRIQSLVLTGTVGRFSDMICQSSHGMEPNDIYSIWAALRLYVARTSNSARGTDDSEALDAIKRTIAFIQPAQPYWEALYLYSHQEYELLPLTHLEDEDFDKLKLRRIAALEELLADEGLGGIERLSSDKHTDSQLIGLLLAETNKPPATDKVVSWFAEDEPLAAVASGYVRGLYASYADAVLDDAFLTTLPTQHIVKLLASLPCEAVVWKKAEHLLSSTDARSYWSASPLSLEISSDSDVAHVLEMYLVVNRAPDAACYAWRCIENESNFPKELLHKLLGQLDGTQDDPRLSCYVPTICRYLESRADTKQLFMDELYLYPLLRSENHDESLFVHRYMSTNPDAFMDLVSLAYAKNTSDENPLAGAGFTRERASDVLWGWTSTPGVTEDGLDSKKFFDWMTRVMELAEAKGLGAITAETIGKCLFHAQPDEALFINSTVADYLDEHQVALEGYRVEAFNSVGAVFLDGHGTPYYERQLEYDEKAVQLEEHGYFNFAEAVRSVARDFRHEGDRDCTEHAQ
jgi:hypothetical protein